MGTAILFAKSASSIKMDGAFVDRHALIDMIGMSLPENNRRAGIRFGIASSRRTSSLVLLIGLDWDFLKSVGFPLAKEYELKITQ